MILKQICKINILAHDTGAENENPHGGNPFCVPKRQRGLLTHNKIADSWGGGNYCN